MGLLIPCIFLLMVSGAVCATQVVNGTRGGSVYFYESIADQGLLLQWSFKNSPIANRVPGFNPGCISRVGCQLYDNGTLRLDNLTTVDEGEYTFTAQQPPSTIVKTVSYELKVYDILSVPVLSSNDTNNPILGGTYVSLHCNAGNQTVTTYTFYRDGMNICSEPHVTCSDSYLHFQPVTESDTGRYTCTIQNPVNSNTSNTLQLSVIDPVSDVKLVSSISGLVWPGRDTISLTCSARGTNVSYSWSLQGTTLPSDPRYQLTNNSRVLTISPVSEKDNETFTCTAKNIINNETSNGIKLSLASNVSEVTLIGNISGSYIWAGEDSVSLNCSAKGSEITFNWMLNGQLLPQEPRYHLSQNNSPPHSILLISPVSRNDNGSFTCNASNLIGSEISPPLSLNLAWLPEKNIMCTADVVGQNYKLGCSWPGGQPAANVTLRFKEDIENGTNTVFKEVPKSTNLQGSTLYCSGDLLGRNSQCEEKFVLPEPVEHNNDTITKSKVGETITLKVNLKPGLPANFQWYRYNPDLVPLTKTNRKVSIEDTNSSSILQIPDVTEKDAGKYECRATNLIGTQSFLFNVEVAKGGLDGGAIAGIVIGVLAAVALIGILIFFIVKKKKRSGDNKRLTEPEDPLGTTVQYATVQKKRNGDVAENQQEDKDDVKYAVIKFPNNNSAQATVPPPVETEYSSIKPSIK